MADASGTSGFALAGAALRVRDPDSVARFYETALGFDRLETAPDGLTLGGADRPTLRLDAAPDAPARRRGSAGLFHLAFLLDSRADLARVVNRLARADIPLSGASDHGVSEALYLDDPEGNGVEIYVDEPRDAWPRDRSGGLAMVTQPLDGPRLMASVPKGEAAAPARVRLGHVHLEVGDVGKAVAFYLEAFPFAQMQRMPSAAFLAADGYHHHLGLNAWRAAGAGMRDPDALGLSEVYYAGPEGAESGSAPVVDPWGTRWRQAARA